jgi:hypothetical protein
MPIDNLHYLNRSLYRDAARIIIACEGALTEPNYFKHFQSVSRKLRLTIVEDDTDNPTLSAPKWVLARAVEHVEKVGLNENDEVYLVMDVDHYEENEFRELHKICKEKKWHLILSNPCFEVWPYMHFKDTFPSNKLKPQHLKYMLSTLIRGGYHPEKILPYTEKALKNAAQLEKNPNHFFPAENTTRINLLVHKLIEFMGINNYNKLTTTKKDKPV